MLFAASASNQRKWREGVVPVRRYSRSWRLLPQGISIILELRTGEETLTSLMRRSPSVLLPSAALFPGKYRGLFLCFKGLQMIRIVCRLGIFRETVEFVYNRCKFARCSSVGFDDGLYLMEIEKVATLPPPTRVYPLRIFILRFIRQGWILCTFLGNVFSLLLCYEYTLINKFRMSIEK